MARRDASVYDTETLETVGQIAPFAILANLPT